MKIFEKLQFDKGPKVSLRISYQDDQLKSVHLEPADTFTCFFANEEIKDWLLGYIEKKSAPYPFVQSSSFQSIVMSALTQIPFGKTLSYQELATFCNCPLGARAVGNACGKNPFPLLIPCHRVLRKNGSLGGFTAGIEVKKRLLDFEREGVIY